MNKKLLKSTLAVAMVAVAGYGGYKAYGGYAGSEKKMNPLLTENVEALSGTESSDAISLEFCWEKKGSKGAYRTICDSRTTNMTLLPPTIPSGDIYECSGSTYQGALSAEIGYCYKKK